MTFSKESCLPDRRVSEIWNLPQHGLYIPKCPAAGPRWTPMAGALSHAVPLPWRTAGTEGLGEVAYLESWRNPTELLLSEDEGGERQRP